MLLMNLRIGNVVYNNIDKVLLSIFAMNGPTTSGGEHLLNLMHLRARDRPSESFAKYGVTLLAKVCPKLRVLCKSP